MAVALSIRGPAPPYMDRIIRTVLAESAAVVELQISRYLDENMVVQQKSFLNGKWQKNVYLVHQPLGRKEF